MKNREHLNSLVKAAGEYLAKGEGEIASMYARQFVEEVAYAEGRGKKPKLHKSPHKGLYDFHFNWKSGGYNNVWAASKAEALKEVREKFGEKWIVDESTLRVLTGLEEEAHWKSNFFD